MKPRILIIFILLMGSKAFSQIGVVSVINTTFLYAGIDNPIEVAVSGYNCDSICIFTNNGTITGDSCTYKIRPLIAGTSIVQISYIKFGDTICLSKKQFKTKNIPAPEVYFFLRGEGFDQGNPMFTRYLECRIENFEFDLRFIIKQFSVSIIRNGKEAFYEKVLGNTFSDNSFKAITEAKSGDVVSVFNVIAYNEQYNMQIEANSTEIVLK